MASSQALRGLVSTPNDGRIPDRELHFATTICPKCSGPAWIQPDCTVKDASGNILRVVTGLIACKPCDKQALKDARKTWRENRPKMITAPTPAPIATTPEPAPKEAPALCPCGCGVEPRPGRRFASRGCVGRYGKGKKMAPRKPKLPKALSLSGKGREGKSPRPRTSGAKCSLALSRTWSGWRC